MAVIYKIIAIDKGSEVEFPIKQMAHNKQNY